MSTPLVRAYVSELGTMTSEPKSLLRRATLEAEDLGPGVDASEAALRAHLAADDPNDELRFQLHVRIAKWDNAPIEAGGWMRDTLPNTAPRRARVVELLGLEEA